MAIDGQWDVTTDTPMGPQKAVLTLKTAGGALTGTSVGQYGTTEIQNGKVDGNTLTWDMVLTQPFAIKLAVEATVTGRQHRRQGQRRRARLLADEGDEEGVGGASRASENNRTYAGCLLCATCSH